MAQHGMAHAERRAGRRSALALAGALAIGCGGNADAEPAAEADHGGAPPQQRASSEASEAEAAGALTLPGIGVDPAPPNDASPLPLPDMAPARAPQPTSVQLTSDTVLVPASGGDIEATLFLARSPQGTLLELVEASERICVRGSLAPVPGNDFPNYWGGEVGLILSSSSPTDVASSGEGLSAPGFAFRLEGALPPLLRFRAGAAGEVPLTSQYCQEVVPDVGSSIEISLAALTYECWLYGGAPYPSAAGATLVSWQMPASVELGSVFDFCIEDIRALP